jgi:hypothetical protein
LAFQATRAFQIWSAILNGSPPRSLGSNGSETLSITDCGHDESEVEKFEYIRQNPVRAGLATVAHEWPYIFIGETAADFRRTGD